MRTSKEKREELFRQGLKQCRKCSEPKLFSEFGNDCSRKDGLNCYCRECCRKYQKENAINVRENWSNKCLDCGIYISDCADRCLPCSNIECGHNRTWMTNRQKELSKILTKEFLRKEYIINQKTPYEICLIVRCPFSTIYNYLRKHCIPTRTCEENQEIRKARKLPNPKLYKNIELIIFKYLGEEEPIHIIANYIGVSYNALRDYMIENRLPIRNVSECQQGELNHQYGACGKLNPNWRDGLSKLPYSDDFTIALKQEIRERDNFTCQHCHITEKEELQKRTGHCLCIHHIDYNKMNCNKNNLITTCHICNCIANGDRDYWFAYYTYIMEDGEC